MAVQAAIWAWVETLPAWQSDLVRRLCANTSLNESELQQVKRNLLAEVGLPDSGPVEKPIPAKLGDIPADAAVSGSVRLRAIGDLKNVGAIEPGQRLVFSRDGLTVIYGDNGAGKSSVARPLKQACRATDTSTVILPNVFSASSAEGEVTIEYEEGANVKTLIRKVNTAPEPVLSTISVFDSGTARFYMANENEVAYIPSGLTLFERLVQAQNRLREMLQEEIDLLQRDRPAFVESEFSTDTPVRQLLSSLSERTVPKEVLKWGSLTLGEEERLSHLEKAVATMQLTDPTKLARDLRRKAEDARRLKRLLDDVGQALRDESVQQVQRADLEAEAALEAARLASGEAFAGEPIRGVGSVPWKLLWDAARKFSLEQAYPGLPFPVTDGEARCVLCHQPYDDQAKQRMRRFEEFVRNDAETSARQAEVKRNQLRDYLLAASVVAVAGSPAQTIIHDEIPELAARVDGFYQSALARLEATKMALQTHSWFQIPQLVDNPSSSIAEWADKLEQEAKVNEQMTQPDEQSKAIKELAELKARKRLQTRLQEVLDYISRLKRASLLQKAHRSAATTSITSKLNELMGQVVTEGLRQRLSQELMALRCESVQVRMDSKGVKGKTHVFLKLNATKANVKVQEVLSEGEQRAVSLAFFLAEISSSTHDGGVILDDPVSSLDHRRRDHVAHRLAQEAKRRQVIVFTHDLNFLFELTRAAEQQGAPCRLSSIRSAAGMVGLVENDAPWLAQDVRARIGHLKNELQSRLRKLESNADPRYPYEAKNFMLLLRETWERLVEERLLNKAILRFDPAIQTQRLEKVKDRLTPDIILEVVQGMTETSAWVHDQAASINKEPPSTPVMEESLRKIEDLSKRLPPR
ncbi:MAG: AAA family ATPase [Bacillota bacterium]